jgi:hypothetical protein
VAEQIHVYFHEVPDDRWGRGGALASEAGETQTLPGRQMPSPRKVRNTEEI